MSSRTNRAADAVVRAKRSTRIGALATLAAGAGLAVAAGPAGAQTPATPVLKVGAHGHQVARLQHLLHKHDVLRTGDKGRFGHGLARAVRRYQKHEGLMVDGIVGLQTWDALLGIPLDTTGSSTSTAPAGSTVTGTSGYTIPSGVVQCESGGNYSAVNPSSGAGGAYQILPSTWAAYGGQGLPQDASPAEQGRIAAEIYANQGPGAWTC